MKKTLLTFGAVTAFVAGALGQGSLIIETENTTPGIAVESYNPSTTTSGEWYNSTFTLELFYAAPTTTSEGEVTALDAAAENNTSSSAAYADLLADSDFTQELLGPSTSQSESVSLTASTGAFSTGTLDVLGIPTSSTGEFILLATTTIGGVTYDGLIGFGMPDGGSPTASPAGTPQDDADFWPSTENLDLAPVPEPTTLALAGLGGLSLLFMRRRKS